MTRPHRTIGDGPRGVRRVPTGARLVAAGLLAAAVLAGCSSKDANSVAQQAKQGDNKGYISGDGTVERIAVSKRAAPVVLSGKTLDGSSWSSASVRGKVVVVNVWGAWCGPCVAEAPALQKAWAGFEKSGKPVRFVGIDFREPAEQGLAFTKKHDITYPSLSDDAGVLVLALQGKASATPSTLVLDTKGRIAARVLGPVDATTLTGLVDDVLAGDSA